MLGGHSCTLDLRVRSNPREAPLPAGTRDTSIHFMAAAVGFLLCLWDPGSWAVCGTLWLSSCQGELFLFFSLSALVSSWYCSVRCSILNPKQLKLIHWSKTWALGPFLGALIPAWSRRMHFPGCWERCWSQGDGLDNLPAFLEGFSPKAFKELDCCKIREQILILEFIPRRAMKDGTVLSLGGSSACWGWHRLTQFQT